MFKVFLMDKGFWRSSSFYFLGVAQVTLKKWLNLLKYLIFPESFKTIIFSNNSSESKKDQRSNVAWGWLWPKQIRKTAVENLDPAEFWKEKVNLNGKAKIVLWL